MNNLQHRFIDFGVSILIVAERLPRTFTTIPITKQLIRSAMSIGANYSESQGSGTRPDFHNKIRIALKEAKETQYWIEILSRYLRNKDLLKGIQSEIAELVSILVVINKKLKDQPK